MIGTVALIDPFLGERLAHRYGYKMPLFFSFFFLSLVMVIFAISRSFLLSIGMLLVFSIIETSFCTIHDSAVQHSIPSRSRATLGSAMNIIWATASALSALLVGISISLLGLKTTTIILGVIALFTGLVYLFSLEQ